jgi:putative ABC transport system ATP-binding protein
MTNTRPILEIENLTVVYNEDTPYEVVALKKFSLTVRQGEIVLISGGNGSGKSTLIRAIGGAVPIKSGKIQFDGVDISKWATHRRARLMAIVHQDTMLGTCPNLTIQENFQLTNPDKWWHLTPCRLSLKDTQIECLKRTGLSLDTRGSSKVNMLSGGQRQAIAVCLAFENKKPLLLFDEFLSALDDKTKDNIFNYTLENAKRTNCTMLMVLHGANEYCPFVDKTIQL